MALYASDGNDYVYAADADPKTCYFCMECQSPVRIRKGTRRLSHFYHLQKSSRCHLYSKSEDHLLLQLQIRKQFSPGSLQIERPFPSILRIADLAWEQKNMVFEIQCSSLDILEARNRIVDYRKVGYHVVWLLDDRIFNKRHLRPTEDFLRSQTCYFFTFNKTGLSFFYDQLELIIDKKRLRTGPSLKINLTHVQKIPSIEWPPDLPLQIQERIQNTDRYFSGDLLSRTIQSASNFSAAIALKKWKALERELKNANPTLTPVFQFFKKYIVLPYLRMLNRILRRSSF